MGSPGIRSSRASATDRARIPSLDGLRAVSISMVLLSHGLGSMPGNWTQRWPRLLGFVANGNRGVSVFFVISGFLITSLLLREHEKTGSIGLRNFYVRRFFRIVPPFYAFLCCLLLLGVAGFLVLTPASFISAMLFMRDYVGGEWWTGHSWSLSIEEQFYLLWPAALVLLRPERAKKVALGIVVAAPVIRLMSHALLHHIGPTEEFMFHVRMDGLMLGCLLALYEGAPLLDRIIARSGLLAMAGVAFLAFGAPYLTMHFGGWYTFPFGYSIEYGVIAVVLLYVVNNPHARIGAILNHRWVAHIGVISYSLYLWQELFLTRLNHTWTGLVPLSFLCCFVAAELSWRLVERPALRMRTRFERQPQLRQRVGTVCAAS
ncbi:MAG: acyltransferase family protein [Terriglobales bacterium]